MQEWFNWLKHFFWEIRGTGLTCYVGMCQDDLIDQNIRLEKSEALNLQPILKDAKINWLIRNFFWKIRGTELTSYVGKCKDYLTDQNIPLWKIRGTGLTAYAKIIWLVRTFHLRNQRHWTHILSQSMQRLFDWSEHSFWKIKGTKLTSYVETWKVYLTNQIIPFKKLETLNSQAMLECVRINWLMRSFLLRNQTTYTLCWNMQRLFDWSENIWDITALDSHPILEDAKIIWLIRTFLMRNQRHRTHKLRWKMQRLFD